jgi:hypothetical protein
MLCYRLAMPDRLNLNCPHCGGPLDVEVEEWTPEAAPTPVTLHCARCAGVLTFSIAARMTRTAHDQPSAAAARLDGRRHPGIE